MHVIVCIDDRNGMAFNHRRQSRDGAVYSRILRRTGDARLWMDDSSLRLFDAHAHIAAHEAFLDEARAGEYCFVEKSPLLPYEAQIESIIVYRWNRVYPADTYLDLLPWEQGWRLISTAEFAGTSHEKITEEVYSR